MAGIPRLYVEGLLLDKSAECCGINHGTGFAWRNKIFDALAKGDENGGLDGIVEANKTFMTVSYKGDAALFSSSEVTRIVRRQGGDNHTRGISDELLCVPCAIDRRGGRCQQGGKVGQVFYEGSREGVKHPRTGGIVLGDLLSRVRATCRACIGNNSVVN